MLPSLSPFPLEPPQGGSNSSKRVQRWSGMADLYSAVLSAGLPNPPSPSTSCGTPPSHQSRQTRDGGSKLPDHDCGSGFTTAAMAAANSNCTANQLTVSVPTGSVTLSNVVIMDSTKITATVQPVQTDPTETATLILWVLLRGRFVARTRTGADTMAETAAATPADVEGRRGCRTWQRSTQKLPMENSTSSIHTLWRPGLYFHQRIGCDFTFIQLQFRSSKGDDYGRQRNGDSRLQDRSKQTNYIYGNWRT